MERRVALELLGLDPGEPLTHDRVRRAYLRRLRAHPPERDPDGFRRLREAFEMLEPLARHAERIAQAAEARPGRPAAPAVADPAPAEANAAVEVPAPERAAPEAVAPRAPIPVVMFAPGPPAPRLPPDAPAPAAIADPSPTVSVPAPATRAPDSGAAHDTNLTPGIRAPDSDPAHADPAPATRAPDRRHDTQPGTGPDDPDLDDPRILVRFDPARTVPPDPPAAIHAPDEAPTLGAVTGEILALLERGRLDAALDLADRWHHSAVDDHRDVSPQVAWRWALTRELVDVGPVIPDHLLRAIAHGIAGDDLAPAYRAAALYPATNPERASDLAAHLAKRAPNLYKLLGRGLHPRPPYGAAPPARRSGRSPWWVAVLVASVLARAAATCHHEPDPPQHPLIERPELRHLSDRLHRDQTNGRLEFWYPPPASDRKLDLEPGSGPGLQLDPEAVRRPAPESAPPAWPPRLPASPP